MAKFTDPYGIKWIRSWDGLEKEKEELHKIANQVAITDAQVRAKYPSSVATGLICEALKEPWNAESIEILRAAEAQQDLSNMNHKLVWTHHLDFDFVRAEWAPILDPSLKL